MAASMEYLHRSISRLKRVAQPLEINWEILNSNTVILVLRNANTQQKQTKINIKLKVII